ncbi:hypothetical protein EcB7A_4724 [Escherichia coli B7A]|nr:hypothetical protein EcB7A_4724 [Escherichia coli B7A]
MNITIIFKNLEFQKQSVEQMKKIEQENKYKYKPQVAYPF